MEAAMAAAHTTLSERAIHSPVTQNILTQLTYLQAIRSLIRENADYTALPEPQKQAVDRFLSAAEEAAELCSKLTKFC